MIRNEESGQEFWEQIYGPNRGYIEEQYELYRAEPENVEASLREIFETYGEPSWIDQTNGKETASGQQLEEQDMKKFTSALQYVEAIRRFGHTDADIYPVGGYKGEKSNFLDASHYGLTEQDLKNIPAKWLWQKAPSDVKNGFEAIERLKKYYTGTITFEYDHVNNHEEREWLFNLIEDGEARIEPSDEERINLLNRLVEVEGFEHFLNKTFVGQNVSL